MMIRFVGGHSWRVKSSRSWRNGTQNIHAEFQNIALLFKTFFPYFTKLFVCKLRLDFEKDFGDTYELVG